MEKLVNELRSALDVVVDQRVANGDDSEAHETATSEMLYPAILKLFDDDVIADLPSRSLERIATVILSQLDKGRR